MNRCVRILSLTVLLLLCFALSACGLPYGDGQSENTSEKTDVESELVTAMLDEIDRRTAEGPVWNAIGEEADIPLFRSLLTDVGFDENKLAYVEYMYDLYYIGDYRSVADSVADVVDVLLTNYRPAAIEDYDAMTGVVITAYAAAIGDKYATYFSADELDDYMEDLGANYTGIGVQVLRMADGYLEILQVYPDTPALDAGLREGDILIEVEGEDIAEIGYNEAVSKVRGEEGSFVNIKVRRDGAVIAFTIRRQKLTEYSVDYRMMTGESDTVGYIRIHEFDDGTPSQFINAYRALKAQGAESFVFDVRANPGGELDSVVAVLEYILPAGEITTLNYVGDANDTVIDSVFDVLSAGTEKHQSYVSLYEDIALVDGSGDHVVREPVTVLLNGYTASAGELFSSAIRDYAEKNKMDAHLIGEKSYGKGTGQSGLRVLTSKDGGYVWDGAYMNISTFTYDPPYGDNYEGEGVIPNDVVTLSPEAAEKSVLKLTLEEDTQLLAALFYLSKK